MHSAAITKRTRFQALSATIVEPAHGVSRRELADPGKLKEPFDEFDRWISAIWLAAHDLLTRALEEGNLSKQRKPLRQIMLSLLTAGNHIALSAQRCEHKQNTREKCRSFLIFLRNWRVFQGTGT